MKIPDGTRFDVVRHMLGNPLHFAAMVAAMLVAMAAVTMMQ